jgi:hypothetical protein
MAAMTKAKQTEIRFDIPKHELPTVRAIVDRAVRLGRRRDVDVDRISMEMDIIATHMNGNTLRLDELLAADDFNFMHDVFGIARHMDRTTGKLTNCFTPRYSA